MISATSAPRVRAVPGADTYGLGDEAVLLAAEAGLQLDPWQADVLRVSLGQRSDGKWSAFEVGVNVPRQNGKGSILEARELAGLFLLPEQMVIHSAHQFDTSLEAFRRLLWLLEDNPRFESQIKRVSRSHGEEGIELLDGSRIRFRTRTKGGGRGFTADCLILDEAMFLPEYGYGALLPILSARENPQVWYTGSAVDKLVHGDGIVFTRVRDRGIAGDDPRLAYFEWSLDFERPEDVPAEVLADPEAWAQSNPALNVRIFPDLVAGECRALSARTFSVERLGVGDYPDPDATDGQIDLELWRTFADPESVYLDPPAMAVDVTPDHSGASIGGAGRRADGLFHVKTIDQRRGTGWVVPRVTKLLETHGALAVLVDDGSPAGALIKPLEAAGVVVTRISAREHAQACGFMVEQVEQQTIRHPGSPELEAAIKGAARRPLGDAWAWSRKSSSVDISPLVACTLALGWVGGQAAGGGFEW